MPERTSRSGTFVFQAISGIDAALTAFTVASSSSSVSGTLSSRKAFRAKGCWPVLSHGSRQKPVNRASVRLLLQRKRICQPEIAWLFNGYHLTMPSYGFVMSSPGYSHKPIRALVGSDLISFYAPGITCGFGTFIRCFR